MSKLNWSKDTIEKQKVPIKKCFLKGDMNVKLPFNQTNTSKVKTILKSSVSPLPCKCE